MRASGWRVGCRESKRIAIPHHCAQRHLMVFALLYVIRGCYWYGDGSMYDGQWLAGKMHGKGIFIYPSGNRCELMI
jgi:hypothetical protein